MLSETLFAVAFIAAAGVLAVSGDGVGVPWAVAVGFVLGLALVRGFHFDLGAGYYTLIQILWVPMLLLVGPYDAPLLVAAAYLLRALVQTVQRELPSDRTLMSVADSWFSLAPALVLIAAGFDGLHWSDWPLFLGALAAQLVFDAVVSCARAYACLGLHPRQILREMIEVYRVDVLLSPVGLIAAFAARDAPAAALLVLPLVLFFRFFAQEREGHVAATLELQRAYRGTALLLGDVIEDDDEYTGQHTRGVVLLAGMVADELGLDESTKRDVEFGALLHDVGKIAIPKEIINKPGKLDDEEWVIMKTHTIEGQKLLERVGGILAKVGVVVRASHERWDGRGYPDGLAREEIPVAARVVSACDAYNAMTTDRSYRQALPVQVALQELRTCADTQFDPEVVVALCSIIERWDPEMLAPVEPGADVDAAIRELLAGTEELEEQ